jgi:hypothetical protein
MRDGREGRFTQRLEARARKIRKLLDPQPWHSAAVSVLERAISLSQDQIDQVRLTHEECLRSLRDLELQAINDYLSARVALRYTGDLLPAIHRLKRELREINKERRQLALARRESLRGLHSHLLNLLEQRSVVKPHGR